MYINILYTFYIVCSASLCKIHALFIMYFVEEGLKYRYIFFTSTETYFKVISRWSNEGGESMGNGSWDCIDFKW